MNRIHLAALIAIGVAAQPASAATIYQSTPSLTAATTTNGYCSECGGNGQFIGGAFALASAATVRSIQFTVTSSYNWPTPVTIGIYTDGGTTVGAQLFGATYSSFTSDTPTAAGTDVVGVDTGDVALTAGNYLIYFSNPNSLAIPSYSTGDGAIRVVQNAAQAPLTGLTTYGISGQSAGYILSDTATGSAVPEPASWALMILGVGMVGGAMRVRSRRVRYQVA